MQGFLPFKYNRHSLDCTVSLLHDDLSQREIHWRYSRVFYVVNDRTWLRFLGLTMYGISPVRTIIAHNNRIFLEYTTGGCLLLCR